MIKKRIDLYTIRNQNHSPCLERQDSSGSPDRNWSTPDSEYRPYPYTVGSGQCTTVRLAAWCTPLVYGPIRGVPLCPHKKIVSEIRLLHA